MASIFRSALNTANKFRLVGNNNIFGIGQRRSEPGSFQASVGEGLAPVAQPQAHQTVRQATSPQQTNAPTQTFDQAQPGTFAPTPQQPQGGTPPPTPAAPPTPTAPIGTPTTQPVSGDLAGALQRSVDEGRFEGAGSDTERAQAQIDFEATQATTLSDEQRNAINSEFAAQSNILDQSAGLLNEQNLIDAASLGFDAQTPLLGAAREQNLGRIATQRGEQAGQFNADIEQQKQDAFSANTAARRLASNFLRGTNQRFGGSSAGDFIRGSQQEELQRTLGRQTEQTGGNISGIQRERRDTFAAFDQQVNDLETNFQAQTQSIALQKDQAIADARNLFTQQMISINNARGQIESDKTNARLDLLQEFRDNTSQIASEVRQASQNLEISRRENLSNIQASVLKFQLESGNVDLGNIDPAMLQQLQGGQFTTPSDSGLDQGGAQRQAGFLDEEEDDLNGIGVGSIQ